MSAKFISTMYTVAILDVLNVQKQCWTMNKEGKVEPKVGLMEEMIYALYRTSATAGILWVNYIQHLFPAAITLSYRYLEEA